MKRQRHISDFLPGGGTTQPPDPDAKPAKRGRRPGKSQFSNTVLGAMFRIKAPTLPSIRLVVGSFTHCNADLFVVPIAAEASFAQYGTPAAFVRRMPAIAADCEAVVPRDTVRFADRVAFCSMRAHNFEPGHVEREELRLASLWVCLEQVAKRVCEAPAVKLVALPYPDRCGPVQCSRDEKDKESHRADWRVLRQYDQFADNIFKARPDVYVYVVRPAKKASQ